MHELGIVDSNGCNHLCPFQKIVKICHNCFKVAFLSLWRAVYRKIGSHFMSSILRNEKIFFQDF